MEKWGDGEMRDWGHFDKLSASLGTRGMKKITERNIEQVSSKSPIPNNK